MQVDRNIQRFGSFEDWPEEFVIQIAFPAVTIDDRSFEAVFTDQPLQFFRGLVWYCRWERSKSGKTRGILLDRIGQEIIRFTSKCCRISAGDLFRTGEVRERTCISIFAASVSAILFSPTSQSCSKSFAAAAPNFNAWALSSLPGPSRKPGLA
jgi:hypothetical protein